MGHALKIGITNVVDVEIAGSDVTRLDAYHTDSQGVAGAWCAGVLGTVRRQFFLVSPS